MSHLQGKTILVVEDDPDLREVLSDEYRLAGAEVTEASCGEEAVQQLGKASYDIVFSDVRMPRGDGRYLAKSLIEMNLLHPPLLFFYSGFNDVTKEEAKALNVAAILEKPSLFTDIEKTILHFL